MNVFKKVVHIKIVKLVEVIGITTRCIRNFSFIFVRQCLRKEEHTMYRCWIRLLQFCLNGLLRRLLWSQWTWSRLRGGCSCPDAWKQLKHITHIRRESCEACWQCWPKHTISSPGYGRRSSLRLKSRSSECPARHTGRGRRTPQSQRLRTAQPKSAAISFLRGLRGFGFTTFRTLDTREHGLITSHERNDTAIMCVGHFFLFFFL